VTAGSTFESAASLLALRGRVDEALWAFLADRREAMAAIDAEAAILVDEVRRLIAAGGKRLRPAFCYWGHRAAGGSDGEPIVRAGAALELLHTMALIHDDLMDGSPERRGVPASAMALAAVARERGRPADAEAFGRAGAILAGDLAAVLADELLLTSGFDADVLVRALGRYHKMRTEMAAGQLLDVGGAAPEGEAARRAAALRGGAYTVRGPLLIGAALVAAPTEVEEALEAFGSPLAEAFQLRDDLLDRDRAHDIAAASVNNLIDEAVAALNATMIVSEVAQALRELADLLRLP
jgi:geranylgeranyl diphosphate synthase, type I